MFFQIGVPNNNQWIISFNPVVIEGFINDKWDVLSKRNIINLNCSIFWLSVVNKRWITKLNTDIKQIYRLI